jgi:hypothetical protein
MKTAVSPPGDLCAAAESLASRLGVTRSRLVALALQEFIAKYRTSQVTERLDGSCSIFEE